MFTWFDATESTGPVTETLLSFTLTILIRHTLSETCPALLSGESVVTRTVLGWDISRILVRSLISSHPMVVGMMPRGPGSIYRVPSQLNIHIFLRTFSQNFNCLLPTVFKLFHLTRNVTEERWLIKGLTYLSIGGGRDGPQVRKK